MITVSTLTMMLLIAFVASSSYYQRVQHDLDPDAKCLDGSPPIIYVHEGGNTKNILFYFIGGGACTGTNISSLLENCYQRSFTNLGSSNSTYYPNYLPGSGTGLL